MIRPWMMLAALILALSLAPAARAGGRVALVIANADYANVPALRNPPADAALVAASLRGAGFTTVDIVQNQSKAALESALQRFGEKADGADVALVYYAGHGIEVGGRNFLIPVSARLLRDRDADFEAVPLDTALRALESAKLRLVLLDACRENPFAVNLARSGQGRSIGRGLARVEPDGDTLVVYAAKAGAIAADGAGANSPFASALAKRIREPGLEINMVFRRVRDDVLSATGRQQEPFTYGSLSGESFYFVPGTPGAPAATAAAPSADPALMETLLWQGVLGAGTEGAYRDYLARYPHGVFATAAQENLRRLGASAASAATPADPPPGTGYIGVQISDIGADLAAALGLPEASGIFVQNVEPGGPAARAGLRAGDVIVSAAGRAVGKDNPLGAVVSVQPVGGRMEIAYIRDGERQTLLSDIIGRPAVEAVATPAATTSTAKAATAQPPLPEKVAGSGAVGFATVALNATIRKQLGVAEDISGVAITAVEAGSDAAAKGLRRGDVIVSINNQPMASPGDVDAGARAVRAQGRDSILLRVFRRGQALVYLPLKLRAAP